LYQGIASAMPQATRISRPFRGCGFDLGLYGNFFRVELSLKLIASKKRN